MGPRDAVLEGVAGGVVEALDCRRAGLLLRSVVEAWNLEVVEVELNCHYLGLPPGGTPPPEVLEPALPPPGCALPAGFFGFPPPDPLPPSPDRSGGPPPADLGRVCRGVHCIGYTAAFAAGLLLQLDDGGGGGGGNLLDGT